MFSCVKFDIMLALVLWLSVSSHSVVGQISFEYDTIYESDACDANTYSSCQKISNCPSALEDIINGARPNICSFDGNEPLVCCDMRRSSRFQLGKNVKVVTVDGDAPENTQDGDVYKPETKQRNKASDNAPVTTRTTTDLSPIPGNQNTISVQKCQEYGYVCTAGKYVPYQYRPKYVGGKGIGVGMGGGGLGGGGMVPAKPKQFPHMALIGFGPENDKSWKCGGSVISTRYILSAAHCTFLGDIGGYANWVRLGDLDYSSITDNAKPHDYAIIQRINHPDYNPPLMYNDIALYKVDKYIDFGHYIKPICLHTTFDIPGREGKAAGWGRIGFVGPWSNRLLYANISFVSPENCKNYLQSNLSSSSFPDGVRTDSLVCAGEADGSKDTCQGDSGGPLFIDQNYPLSYCLFRQVGITSAGLPCNQENSPGLYTRVSKYVPWIESIVWANDL